LEPSRRTSIKIARAEIVEEVIKRLSSMANGEENAPED
jgi:hypothetical protein